MVQELILKTALDESLKKDYDPRFLFVHYFEHGAGTSLGGCTWSTRHLRKLLCHNRTWRRWAWIEIRADDRFRDAYAEVEFIDAFCRSQSRAANEPTWGRPLWGRRFRCCSSHWTYAAALDGGVLPYSSRFPTKISHSCYRFCGL